MTCFAVHHLDSAAGWWPVYAQSIASELPLIAESGYLHPVQLVHVCKVCRPVMPHDVFIDLIPTGPTNAYPAPGEAVFKVMQRRSCQA